LTVVVRVHVDKTGGDDVSSRIDDFVCLTIDMRFDGDDLAISYSDVCCERRTSGSVDHGSTANDEIEHASPRNAGTDRCRLWGKSYGAVNQRCQPRPQDLVESAPTGSRGRQGHLRGDGARTTRHDEGGSDTCRNDPTGAKDPDSR